LAVGQRIRPADSTKETFTGDLDAATPTTRFEPVLSRQRTTGDVGPPPSIKS
jgi:hypothetical protein